MKTYIAVVVILVIMFMLEGCASFTPMGSLSPETVKAVAEAGGGCIEVDSQVGGRGSVSVGAAQKGTLHNGRVIIACGRSTITIEDNATAKALNLIPGTVTTVTTPQIPGTTTTTVAPIK